MDKEHIPSPRMVNFRPHQKGEKTYGRWATEKEEEEEELPRRSESAAQATSGGSQSEGEGEGQKEDVIQVRSSPFGVGKNVPPFKPSRPLVEVMVEEEEDPQI